MLTLATIQLTMTNRAVNETARATLTQLVSDSVLGSLALRHLLADAVAHKNFTDALAYSRRINSYPQAMYSDKVEYLNLLRTSKSEQADTWQTALEKTAAYEPENAYTLARWMILSEGSRTAYLWLCSLPPTTQTNQAIVLLKTDCLIGIKDWSGLLNVVKSQEWGGQEFYRIALMALAQRLAWSRRGVGSLLGACAAPGFTRAKVSGNARRSHGRLGLVAGEEPDAARGAGQVPGSKMGGRSIDGPALLPRQYSGPGGVDYQNAIG